MCTETLPLNKPLEITTEMKSWSFSQRIGVYVLKASGFVSILQCMLAAMYMLFLIWKGVKSYSTLYRQDCISIIQVQHTHIQASKCSIMNTVLIQFFVGLKKQVLQIKA